MKNLAVRTVFPQWDQFNQPDNFHFRFVFSSMELILLSSCRQIFGHCVGAKMRNFRALQICHFLWTYRFSFFCHFSVYQQQNPRFCKEDLYYCSTRRGVIFLTNRKSALSPQYLARTGRNFHWLKLSQNEENRWTNRIIETLSDFHTQGSKNRLGPYRKPPSYWHE